MNFSTYLALDAAYDNAHDQAELDISLSGNQANNEFFLRLKDPSFSRDDAYPLVDTRVEQGPPPLFRQILEGYKHFKLLPDDFPVEDFANAHYVLAPFLEYGTSSGVDSYELEGYLFKLNPELLDNGAPTQELLDAITDMKVEFWINQKSEALHQQAASIAEIADQHLLSEYGDAVNALQDILKLDPSARAQALADLDADPSTVLGDVKLAASSSPWDDASNNHRELCLER